MIPISGPRWGSTTSFPSPRRRSPKPRRRPSADWHLTAIATFPTDRPDEFLAANWLTPSGPDDDGTPMRRAVTSADRPGDPAWNPDAATTVLSFGNSHDTIGGVYRRLLLDLDDPATVRLYPDAFTT